jgi:hypothetical protein
MTSFWIEESMRFDFLSGALSFWCVLDLARTCAGVSRTGLSHMQWTSMTLSGEKLTMEAGTVTALRFAMALDRKYRVQRVSITRNFAWLMLCDVLEVPFLPPNELRLKMMMLASDRDATIPLSLVLSFSFYF